MSAQMASVVNLAYINKTRKRSGQNVSQAVIRILKTPEVQEICCNPFQPSHRAQRLWYKSKTEIRREQEIQLVHMGVNADNSTRLDSCK